MKNILIVEDDRLLQRSYADEFSDMEIHIVDTADKAFEFLAHAIPDFVLIDVMLAGGKNGFDILEFLKGSEILKHIPVVMMTNLGTEKDTALSMGATDYCIKAELDLPELHQKILKLLE